MSRAAVYDMIRATTGLPAANVIPNFRGDGRPANLDPAHKHFVVIQWLENTSTGIKLDNPTAYLPRIFEVWSHFPYEAPGGSTDYERVDGPLENIETALLSMEHVAGSDGRTVTMIEFSGRSGDLTDPAFKTICRRSVLIMHSRKT